ncbi:coiled-coil domain-containing protein 186 isoform X1 [Bombus terrestris]|uniref:Coiled-coil domain-containing protein 186 isoform X1 n=1 Tax=Bombus terrestris TaxID=30195 RepID=A0A9B2MPU2_BOMTE|nr:coiled-coil domain-containing protein 186 isoform X1 [Bombus terrestris]
MEFTVGEMEGTKLELSFQDKILSENVNQADSSVKSDVSIAEDINLIIQQDIKIHEETMPIHEELVQDSTDEIRGDSVLVKNSDEKKYQLIERNNIDTTVKSSTSLSNFTSEFIKCQTSVDTILPQEKCLQKSSSCNDIRLSSTTLYDTLLCTSSDTISNHNVRSISPNTICNDEEEIIFNTKLYMEEHETKSLKNIVGVDTHENCEVKENIGETEEEVYHSNANGKLLVNNGQAPRNLVKYEKNFNEEQKLCAIIKDTKIQSNVISRPTLVDDSRLVKISLPTNPINIMQSNAQFLNKSRNFLNFITEKSTNIMEKALLPQHIAMRYNSVMKSVDNICNEKRYTEESSGMESSLTGLAFNNTSDSFLKTKSISCVTKGQMDVQTVENEYVKNDENKNTFMLSSNETISGNIEQNSKYLITNEYIFDQNNVIDHSSKLKDSKQSESSSIGNNVNKTNDNVLCANTNRNHNLNFVVLNPDNNIEEAITDTIYKKEEVSTDFEESKQSLLQHPIYLTLLKDYADLKSKHLKLQEKVEHLEERNRILEAENKGEVFSVQIETLEKTINRLTLELHTSLEAQEMYKKEYSAANKERESMVMKYAVSEKQLIDTQRAKESAERKVKEMTMQQETLHSKLREMQGERGRICNILTGKHREVIDLQREVEKLKEDVKMRDIKLQWTQNKLKTEMDLQKETQQKLDKATIRINEMKEECEQVRKETQETMRKFQQSEENKAVTLDQQLKEQQARLILERHVTEDKEMLRVQLQKEVDTLKHRQQVLIEENNMLSLKIQDVEKNRLNYESNLNNLKIITDQRQKEITELLSKVSELESLKTQLQHKNQYLASTEVEIQHLRLANEELQADMSACQQKEAEMLDFTQKLTDKNVRLQSEFTAIEAKAKQLEQEHGPLYQRISELIDKVKVLEENLAREKKARIEESEVLERCLTEQTQAAKNLAQQLEDSQGENAVLKRKQQLSMKEMTRELQQCRKKLDAFETSIPYNSLSVASRTGSNISLITGDALNGALSDNSINGDQSIQPTEPSRQLLIDRIIKLQESNARKAEKLDFFEEHARILVEELQKKKKIIQTYILHENIGAMGGNERDKYKHIKSRRNAAELARHGGIMASVYNQRVSDDNMTLELSLEINQKLQAVLEDALFKNITLKDNIDTLGEEIARLTMQNQQRQNTH